MELIEHEVTWYSKRLFCQSQICTQWILTPCLLSSSWMASILTSPVTAPVFRLTAAATPAACPVTVHAIMFRIAACDVCRTGNLLVNM